MFGFRKKDQEVADRIQEYTALVGTTVATFRDMVVDYLAWDKRFKKESQLIHQMETRADSIRREIERQMLKGAVLPAFRADYIRLVETMDRVANKAEEAADNLYLLRPDIPEPLREGVGNLVRLTVECWEPIPEMVQRLLNDKCELGEAAARVSAKEGEIDAIQWNLLRTLYKEVKVERVIRLENKLLVDSLAQVSDRIENVADEIALAAVKRRL